MSPPPYAEMALALTKQEWSQLSLGDDPATAATSDLDIIVDRATSLMLVRIVAVVAPTVYKDISTTTICSTAIKNDYEWPAKISPEVQEQLRAYVHKIISGYKDVPYHNREHAFHVILSANKLIDMMVLHIRSPTYGLRKDPLMLLAQMFSALIHDVEHQGIPNRQLALEDDRLAILYNDQSIAEHWSCYVGFSELLQEEYKALREVMFPEQDDYYRFRKAVIDVVLSTDIASPERTQLLKSKWKEAFGDPYETIERKVRAQARRMSLGMAGKEVGPSSATHRRGTGDTGSHSEISLDAIDDGKEDDAGSSGSLTPENSQHGEEGKITEVSAPSFLKDASDMYISGNTGQKSHRSASMDMISPRASRFERRMSTQSRVTANSTYRKRLGIQRAIDLSGETIETYRRGSMATHFSISSGSIETDAMMEADAEDADELKAFVVMETIMTAADVAHNLQGWEHMVKWSGRLYLELRKAYKEKRGIDAKPRWFENQIGFLESYLLPLARKLEDTNVFGDLTGAMFPKIVESNRDKWLTDGYDVAQETIAEGQKKFPIEGEADA